MSYTHFFCKKDDTSRTCTQYNIIEENQTNIYVCLSYTYLCNNASESCQISMEVKTDIYEKLKKNYNILTHSDFMDFIKIAKEVNGLLPREEKENLLIKLSILIKMRGIKLDLFQGIALDNGLVFMFDNTYSNLEYIRAVTRY